MEAGSLSAVASAMPLVVLAAVIGGLLAWRLASRRGAAERERAVAEVRERAADEAEAVRRVAAAEAEATRAPLAARAEALAAQLDEFRGRETLARQETERLRLRLADSDTRATELEARMAAADMSHAENLARLNGLVAEADKRLADQFKALAAQILDEKTAKFTETNRTRLDELLTPFRERLAEFQKKVEDTHLAEMQGQSALKGELDRLVRLNQQVSEEAHNLTTALKGENKTQGNWGELILSRALEMSGLEAGREYRLQDNQQTDAGGRRQPDVVITLPDNRFLIIDSKVSLVAWERFSNADHDEDRERALKEHLVSLNRHVSSLGEKNYPQLYGVAAVDFVLLFVPLEPALLAALKADNGLYEAALQKNVVLVGPSSLLATLRVVQHVWRMERQNRNVEEIARIGGLLYDSFVSFAAELEKVQKSLGTASSAADNALRILSSGGPSLVRRAEKLRELGVKARKQLPASLTGADDDDAPEPAEEPGPETPAGGPARPH